MPYKLKMKIPKTVLHDSRRVQKAIVDDVEKAVTEALEVVDEQVTIRTPRVTGDLATSLTPKVIRRADGVDGRYGTNSLYFLPVELGQKPHWAPAGPLIWWARRKFGVSGREASQIGYALRASIKKRGTKGKYFAKAGLEAALSRVKRILRGVGIEIVSDLLEKR